MRFLQVLLEARAAASVVAITTVISPEVGLKVHWVPSAVSDSLYFASGSFGSTASDWDSGAPDEHAAMQADTLVGDFVADRHVLIRLAALVEERHDRRVDPVVAAVVGPVAG